MGKRVSLNQISELLEREKSDQLDRDRLQWFMDELGGKLPLGGPHEQLRSWMRFYKKFFSLSLDWDVVNATPIPRHVGGFDRLVLVANVSLLLFIRKLDENFVWKIGWDQLDRLIDRQWVLPSDRSPDHGIYLIWVKDQMEPDDNLAGIRRLDLAARGVKSMTLLEYLLFHLKIWDEIEVHPSQDRYTYCAGSAFSAHVPVCKFTEIPATGFLFAGQDMGYTPSYMAARQVISR